MDFKRSLSANEYSSWMDLVASLQWFSLMQDNDRVVWALEKTKHFTTKSLCRFLADRGVSSKVAGLIWKSRIPLKIKFFLWQVFNGKL